MTARDWGCALVTCVECGDDDSAECARCEGYGSRCSAHDSPPCGACGDEGRDACIAGCWYRDLTGEVHT